MSKTIFDKLNLDDVKRFEEIISLENVDCILNDGGINANDKQIEIQIDVCLYGTDNATKFRTRHQTYHSTFQEAIESFLKWWDKEIIRFNSFNHLTKSNKK